MTSPPVSIECACPSCTAASEAILDTFTALIESDHCSHSILDGAVRAIADSAAILAKTGREAFVRDHLLALFAARFDRTVIRSAQIDQRNAGRVS